MTLDERIEALTMNAELQALESAKHDRQIAALARFIESDHARIARLTRVIESDHARIAALTRLIELDAENIRALARVAEAHELRLDRLDGGAQADSRDS